MNETANDRRAFEGDLAKDLRYERSLPWRELMALGVVVAVVVLHRLFA